MSKQNGNDVVLERDEKMSASIEKQGVRMKCCKSSLRGGLIVHVISLLPLPQNEIRSFCESSLETIQHKFYENASVVIS